MKKIGIICLNASVDLTYTSDHFEKGTLNRVRQFQTDYAGKGINAAIASARLGASPILLSVMGKNEAPFFEEKLRKEGVLPRWILRDAPLRRNVKLYEGESLTEINSENEKLNEKEKEELLFQIQKLLTECAVLLLCGSVPQGISSDFYRKIILKAKERNIKTVLDADGVLLKEGIQAKPDCIKPNLSELEGLFQKSLSLEKEQIDAARRLPVETVLLSKGKEGAMLITKNEVYSVPAPQVEIQSAIGSGDSMTGVLCTFLFQEQDKKSVLCKCVAAGSATAMEKGSQIFQVENYERLLSLLEKHTV